MASKKKKTADKETRPLSTVTSIDAVQGFISKMTQRPALPDMRLILAFTIIL